MTSTNVPPNNDDEQLRINQLRAQIDLATATRQLNGSLLQAGRQLAGRVAGFVNPLNRLEDSIMRLDKTNRSALALGTTNEKLTNSINKNSDILGRNRVSTQKLLDAIVNNFGQGVRVQSGAIMDLTEEMIATGQDINGLTTMNSDLLLFTGENIKAVQQTNKANKDISDKYGVSNEKLIASVNSLRDVFEESSFFGGETTASLEILTKELKARTGGKNVEGAIRTLFGLGTGGIETLGAALRTGAGGLRARISGGQAIGMQDIMPILQEVSRIASESGGGNLALGADIAAMRTGLTRQQVNQLLQLNEALKVNNELSADQKKTTDETFNTIQNINERARNFYDNTAIASLAALGTISTSVVTIAAQFGMAGGAVRSLRGLQGGEPISMKAGRRAGLFADFLRTRGVSAGKIGLGAGLAYGTQALAGEDSALGTLGGVLGSTLTGASIGTLGGGPIGALIGGAGGLIVGIMQAVADNTAKTAKATQTQADIEAQKMRQERAQEAAREVARITFLANYLRSRTDLTFGKEIIPFINQLIDETAKLPDRIAKKRGVSVSRNGD